MDVPTQGSGSSLAVDSVAERVQESLLLCPTVDNSGISHEYPKGLRRWGRGRWKHDWTYWNFGEYIEWVQTTGMAEDRHGNQGYWAAALDLWNRSIDKEQETEQWQQTLAADVAALEHMPLQEIIGANVVFEIWEGEKNAPGNSLHVRDDDEADFLGGADPRSSFTVELVAASPPKQYVHLKNTHTGGYLRLRDNDGRLDCRGSSENLEGTVFEVLVRDNPTPLLSLAAEGGKVIGIFVPRKAKDAMEEVPPVPWWREGLLAKTRAWIEVDPQLNGKRRHIDDHSCKLYSFEEFVIFSDENCWGGPLENGALLLAKLVWQRGCIPEHIDSTLQGRRWHPRDATYTYYSFEAWVDYIQEQGWADWIGDGVIPLATQMWEQDLVPEEENTDSKVVPMEPKDDNSCATKRKRFAPQEEDEDPPEDTDGNSFARRKTKN